MARAAEKLIDRYIKESGPDDTHDHAAPMKHEDADLVKDKLDGLCKEHDMEPVHHEDSDDMTGGHFHAKAGEEEDAEKFVAAAKEALEPHVESVDGNADGKMAHVEYKYK